MMTDLEDELRRALHDRADRITPDRLLHRDTARPTRRCAPRSRWALAAPVAAAACVALVAVAITLAPTGGKNQANPAGPGASLTALYGTSWDLTSVRNGSGTTIKISPKLSASVTFERGDVFSAQDGANAYRATYAFTTARDMLIANPTAQTTGGSIVGNGRAAAAAAEGIHAILYRAEGRAASHSVTVSHRPHQLKLTANGYTLTFAGEVLVATSSAPAPSRASGR